MGVLQVPKEEGEKKIVGRNYCENGAGEKKTASPSGRKKLYFMLEHDLAQLEESPGRDRFFDILRNNELLVKRRKKFVNTTDSHHRFHKHKSLIKGIRSIVPTRFM